MWASESIVIDLCLAHEHRAGPFRLTESETKTAVYVFADHAGVIVDSTGVVRAANRANLSDMFGVRISPRQSPSYQPRVIDRVGVSRLSELFDCSF
jgi:hypothetical protein